MYYQNQWGNICPDNGGRTLANTVCYQLGYNGAISYGDGTDDMYVSLLHIQWLCHFILDTEMTTWI